MFNKNTNYLLSPSIHTPHRTSEILLHQHEMLYGNYLAANANTVRESSSILNNQDPCVVFNTCPKKQTVKKDRHSKIQTAQGPRDRRVRLSIGIARKFFDLQEMLGFDKPSKTLDWLLTKSKTAIKDLVQTKQRCQVKDLENGKNSRTKSAKEGQDLQLNLAKESRVKARARARERTREKMCIKQINENRNTTGYDLNPSNVVPIQYMNNELEVCKISGCQPPYEAGIEEGLIQESIVIRRKVMKNPSIFGFQQTLSPYNVTHENWDISSFTQSNMFVNRSSNN